MCCCPFELRVDIMTRYRSCCSSDAPFDAIFVAPCPCCHAPLPPHVDAAVNFLSYLLTLVCALLMLPRCCLNDPPPCCHAPLPPQVDAAVNPGGWGGPLLDSRGACVGMAFQKYASQTWFERCVGLSRDMVWLWPICCFAGTSRGWLQAASLCCVQQLCAISCELCFREPCALSY